MNFNFINNNNNETADQHANRNYVPFSSHPTAAIVNPSYPTHPAYSSTGQWSTSLPNQMPWTHNAQPYQNIMSFGTDCFASTNQSLQRTELNSNMQQKTPPFRPSGSFSGAPTQPAYLHQKRKSDAESYVPTKQHISDEKMASHLAKLHISTETPICTVKDEDGSETEMPAARERRLVLCEEMRKLQTDSVIPQQILKHQNNFLAGLSPNGYTKQSTLVVNSVFGHRNVRVFNRPKPSFRLERPCMAVMLWQPPEKASGTIENIVNGAESKSGDSEDDDSLGVVIEEIFDDVDSKDGNGFEMEMDDF